MNGNWIFNNLTANAPTAGRLFKTTTQGGIDSLDDYTLTDPAGGRFIKVSVTGASGGSGLFLEGGVMGASLRAVEDSAGTNSPLQLSTTQAVLGSSTAAGRLVVRGDGTNPIARFESSTGAISLQMLNSGALTLSDGNFTVSNGNIAVAGKITSTGGYNNASGNIIPSFESSVTCSNSAGSANFRPVSVSYTLNNTGAQTGTATGIFLNATETALNGMTHNLMDLQIGGVSRFSINSSGGITALGTIQTTAGNLQMGASSVLIWSGRSRILSGTGSPEGVVIANQGSLFLRTDGGSSTSFYVKESGTGNTGWVAK